MAIDPRAQTVAALNRFALPIKSGASLPSDARAALLADLDGPSAGQIANGDLPNVGEAARAVFQFRQERKAARMAQAAEHETKQKAAGAESSEMAAQRAQPKKQPGVPQQ